MAKGLADKIESHIDRVGIFHRTFFRCKKERSVEIKIRNKNYDGEKSFLRDIIGIGANLYFADDIDILYPYFKGCFDLVEETKDVNIETEFKPTRLNMVFRLQKEFKEEFRQLVGNRKIDDTFEFQIRTVLSEGWHEVDHDLRYKCRSDWVNQTDLSRMFNGILASLETSDWTVIQLFDALSYQHYKSCCIESMIRSKFRIRIVPGPLDIEIREILISESYLRKRMFKIDRSEFLTSFLNSGIMMPITMTNLVFLLNYMFLKDEKINSFTPDQLIEEFGSKYRNGLSLN